MLMQLGSKTKLCIVTVRIHKGEAKKAWPSNFTASSAEVAAAMTLKKAVELTPIKYWPKI